MQKPTPTPLLDIAPSNPFLSKKDKEAVESKKSALDKLLEDKGLAKYKIDLLFGRNFRLSEPSAGALSFFESGNKLHGGGDTIIHFCPGKGLGRSDCEAPILDGGHGYGFLICPECHTAWQGEQVFGQILARLTPAGWAKLVLKYFLKFGMKADIRIKYHPDDLRSAAMREQNKQKMGDDLNAVRAKRATRIYKLSALIKDTNAGADLEGRILAFIRA